MKNQTPKVAATRKPKDGNEPFVKITWYGKEKPVQIPLTHTDEIQDTIDVSPSYVESFSCDLVGLTTLLDALQPIAHPDLDEITINGVMVFAALIADENWQFVPEISHSEVEILCESSASWLPGGPCVMEQSERILRFGDLYWVEAHGDWAYGRFIVGRYTSSDQGIKASVALSSYFSYDKNGKVVCELDEIGHNE